jgi:hypothetical protein
VGKIMPFFRVIKETEDYTEPKVISSTIDIENAHHIRLTYALDNSTPLKHLKIIEITEVTEKTLDTFLLSNIIEWANELRECNSNCIENKFLSFDIGTPIHMIITYIKSITGHDLTYHLRDKL